MHGVDRSRRIEQACQRTLPAHTLMRRAGLSAARLALALAPHARRVWIAAGPGNNGGDGLEAALHLQRAGKSILVSLCGDVSRLPDDARDAHARAVAAGVVISNQEGPPDPPDIAIDALLGIGATRAPAGTMAGLVAQLNALRCPVLSLDLPSGMNADTGQAYGEDCVVAQHTLSLLSLKPGLFTGSGRDLAGTVWFDPLEVDTPTGEASSPDAWLSGAAPVRQAMRPRPHAQHKGSFGDVAVVGGAAGMAGAALLAARAALAAGAGRVFVQWLDAAAPTVDPCQPELMLRADWTSQRPETLAETTVVCGCGGGDAVRATLPALLGRAARLVLDADALNAVAIDGALQKLLAARSSARRSTVLTPHPLEAARLLGSSSAQVQDDRLAAARALAEKFACVVLLKGSGSVLAAPGRVPHINPTGNASLASAGTGDVLAGLLGALWSQRRAMSAGDAAFSAALAAAHLHGSLADPQACGAVRAGELIKRIAAAMSTPEHPVSRDRASSTW